MSPSSILGPNQVIILQILIDENLWIFVFVIYFSSSFYDEIHSEFDFGNNLNFPFKAIFQSQFQINFFPIPLNSHQSKVIGCLITLFIHIFPQYLMIIMKFIGLKCSFFPDTRTSFCNSKSFSFEKFKNFFCMSWKVYSLFIFIEQWWRRDRVHFVLMDHSLEQVPQVRIQCNSVNVRCIEKNRYQQQINILI